MSEAKHTPGPWFYGDWINNKPGEHDRAGWVEVWNIQDDGFKGFPFIACKHHDEIANARLIAAAPELLEALEECLELARDAVTDYVMKYGESWRPGELQSLRATVKKAEAALAKATGDES